MGIKGARGMRKADLIAAISEGGYPEVGRPAARQNRGQESGTSSDEAGNSAPSDAVVRRLLRTPNSINLQGERKLRR
ncbi:transcription termination factor Rho [Cutibacterium acnes JCM 18909]|nr:transcription termination factor Rho [Cutibacterium acnes JCM 18909]